MSDTDSFIEEVTEDLRRDRLFGYVRRYGWIAAILIVAIVGGAAWNEVRKAQEAQVAQDFGDAVLSALEGDSPDLTGITAEGAQGTVLALLSAGDDDPAALDQLIADPSVDPLYRDLARLKRVIAAGDTLSADEKLADLDQLTAPGGPFRVLAQEQRALILAETGDTAGAVAVLRPLLEDGEASQGLRQRASQLIVALGEELTPGE